MTLRTLKRGITRLCILLAVAYDLYALFAIVQDYTNGTAKDMWLFIGIVAALNVAAFALLKACFWVLDGFSKEKV